MPRRLAGAVTDVSRRSLPHPRHDTPTPGWESGVWVRIERRRRVHRLGALVLAVMAGGAGAWLTRRSAVDAKAGVGVHAELQGALRPDGSAPLHARWRVSFEGAELRVYRNELGVVHRCPGSPGCTDAAGGGMLTMPLGAPGEYRALVFSRPARGVGPTLRDDLEAARARGEQVEMSASLVAY